MRQQYLRGWARGPGIWAKRLGQADLSFELWPNTEGGWTMRHVNGVRVWSLKVSSADALRATLEANRALYRWLKEMEGDL